MRIAVRVSPSSSKRQVRRLEDGSYKVHIFSAPQRNKANKELLEVLSKYFSKREKDFLIIKGVHSRHKIIEIKD